MKTSSTASAAVKTLLLSLLTTSLFCAAGVMADQVGSVVASKKVTLNDLNLASPEGQEIARQRVRQMARTLCTQVADPTDLSHHANYLACMDSALANAGASVQALIDKQSTARFAQVNVN